MTTEEILSHPDSSMPPDTTQEEDRHTLAQRRIDLTWERTQALIAVVVTLSVVSVAAYLTVSGRGSEGFTFLVGMGNLVIGFYFGRTNHARAGGTRNVK